MFSAIHLSASISDQNARVSLTSSFNGKVLSPACLSSLPPSSHLCAPFQPTVEQPFFPFLSLSCIRLVSHHFKALISPLSALSILISSRLTLIPSFSHHLHPDHCRMAPRPALFHPPHLLFFFITPSTVHIFPLPLIPFIACVQFLPFFSSSFIPSPVNLILHS